MPPQCHTRSRRRFLQAGLVGLGSPSVLAATTAAEAPPGPLARWIPAEGARSDVQLMERALRWIHPGLTRRAPESVLAQHFDRLRQVTQAPVSEGRLYLEISAALAALQCSHTKADPSEAVDRWRHNQPTHLPFRFRMVEGRMLLISAWQEAIGAGAEVLELNGLGAGAWATRIDPLLSADGHTPWSRQAALGADGDLMGSGLDHFWPYLVEPAPTVSLTWRQDDTSPARRSTLPMLTFKDWLSLPHGGGSYRADFGDATQWRLLKAAVGYLRIDTFVNYRRPVDAQALLGRALGELREAGARALIVDLRHNGGGSDEAALALLDHLALQPYTYQKAIRLKAVRYGDLPPYIQTWGDRQALFEPPLSDFVQTPEGWWERRPATAAALLLPRTPAPQAFQGPVRVLTSPVNQSGATMVIAKLRDMGRAVLMGEPCGGSADGPTAGRIFQLKLPSSGIAVRVPLAWNLMDVQRPDTRGGLVPDVLHRPSMQEWRSGQDVLLEMALGSLA